MKAIISLSFFMTFLSAFAQTEKIGQTDLQGKKDGKWIIYLDKNWKQVDSSSALYYRYTFYDKGTNIYPMGPSGGKNYKLESTGSGKQLDGEYKWFDAKGKLSSVHI